MCIKAVADYSLKKRYQQVSGVFWFRLNPHDVPEMIGNQKLSLEKVFSWGLTDDNRDKTFEPNELKGGLVFLDGFDELKSSLEKNNILDNRFHTQVNQLAKRYKLHIVVTSRTRALEQVNSCTKENLIKGDAEIKCEFRDGGSRKNTVRMLAPLTDEEQLAWINELIDLRKNNGSDTSDLEQYRQTFQSLQKNKDVKGLLEIPILLRMIVQNCYEPSSGNRVDLYRNLFNKTLLRQGIEDQRERLHSIYREIAFRIFVYDDDSAELNKGEFKEIAGSDAYLYQYYLHTPGTGAGQDREDQYSITFLHRSFYQYFLSEFLYEKLETITDVQGGINFLKYLWARRLDNYVLDNLRYMAKDVNTACKCVLSAIEETDAILPDYEKVSYSKEHLGNYDMANNVFWNAVSICNSLFQKKIALGPLELSRRIAELLSKYDCSEISLRWSSLNTGNMRGAQLGGADLSDAYMSCAIMSHANLCRANLRNINLNGAHMRNADLSNADLGNANLSSANLSSACLSIANLRGANLSNANLSCAYLSGADLNGACLIDTYMSYANLSSTNLIGANLSDANMSGADLSNADLRFTNLIRANLIGANLSGANLMNAKVSRSQYTYISIKDVKNLDKIIVIDND